MLKKRFGQNLLVNKNIVKEIVKSAEITKDDTVIEIGAGTGLLTKEILQYAGKVFAFEIDRDFIPVLDNLKKENPNLEIIHGDFLKYDMEKLFNSMSTSSSSLQRRLCPNCHSEAKPKNLVSNPEILHCVQDDKARRAQDDKKAVFGILPKYILLGNIPYNITSLIITRIFQKNILNRFSKIIFMTQLEYAKRLTALPGGKDYGSITVFVRHYADAMIIRKVSKGNFKPVPKVDSAVIKITPLPAPRHACDETILFTLVRAAFGKRRKKITNSLLDADIFKNNVGAYCNTPLRDILEKAGIDPDLRAENLSLEDYVKIANAIKGN